MSFDRPGLLPGPVLLLDKETLKLELVMESMKWLSEFQNIADKIHQMATETMLCSLPVVESLEDVPKSWAKLLTDLFPEVDGVNAGFPVPVRTAHMPIIHNGNYSEGLLALTRYYAEMERRRRLKRDKQTDPAAWLPEVTPEESNRQGGWTKVNEWYSHRKNALVHLLRNKEGNTTFYLVPQDGMKNQLLLDTYIASSAISIKAEDKAVAKLKDMIKPVRFHQYLLTGMLPVISKRSGVLYLVRKMRPTLAYRSMKNGNYHFLASLCCHPVGYYYGSWCGVMCPTDEVIAHMLFIQGDEHTFWKKSIQHQSWEVTADC